MPDEPRDRGLHRHSEPPKGEEQPTVTGRPNDLGHIVPQVALDNSTLASRAKARQANEKAVSADEDDVEDKAVKAPRRGRKAG